MSHHIRLGKEGEKEVKRVLEQNGYLILETNYRTRYGEIDIIAEKKNVLVFVEVKTRASNTCGIPEEAVGFRKQERIRKLALNYLGNTRRHYKEVRFDVAAVISEKDGSVKEIRFYEGAF